MLENVLFKGLKKPKEKKIKKIQQSFKIEGEDLNSLSSFKDLKVKSIFESPKLVQQIVIPYILKDKNICVQSFTGSGKTLSYLLPLVELSFKKRVKAIVLVPNDQLKEQVKKVLNYEIISENKAEIIILRPDEILKKCAGSRVNDRVSDDNDSSRVYDDNLNEDDGSRVYDDNDGNDGILNTKLTNDIIKHSLINITHLIIDEADLMIHKDSLNLFKSLSSILNSCTVSVFSATLNREVEKIIGMFKDFTKIYVSNKGSISHKFVFGTQDKIKHLSLEQIIEEGVEVPCLVFVNNKEMGNKLSERIPRSAFFDNTQSPLSSSSLLDDFRLKKIWFLFTTDILSRGIDFINTKSVINYDFPKNKTIFIHRAGRVNRNTTGQKVITIYTIEDFKKLKEIVEILKENGSKVEEHIEKLYK